MSAHDPKDARIEDLEEALRLVLCILQPGKNFDPHERDWAALAVICDQLGIDMPEDAGSIQRLLAGIPEQQR